MKSKPYVETDDEEISDAAMGTTEPDEGVEDDDDDTATVASDGPAGKKTRGVAAPEQFAPMRRMSVVANRDPFNDNRGCCSTCLDMSRPCAGWRGWTCVACKISKKPCNLSERDEVKKFVQQQIDDGNFEPNDVNPEIEIRRVMNYPTIEEAQSKGKGKAKAKSTKGKKGPKADDVVITDEGEDEKAAMAKPKRRGSTVVKNEDNENVTKPRAKRRGASAAKAQAVEDAESKSTSKPKPAPIKKADKKKSSKLSIGC